MNVRTERRGLGRGLGELFQRTLSRSLIAASADGDPSRHWRRFRRARISPRFR